MKDVVQQLRAGLGRGPLTPWGETITDAANEIETLRADLKRLWHFAGCPYEHCQKCIDDAEWIKRLHERLGPPSAESVQAQHDDR